LLIFLNARIGKYRKYWKLLLILDIIEADNGGMEGMTVSEIAKELDISVDAVRKRIETAGIKPITREALYDKSVLPIINSVKMGRPKKATESAKPVSKAKKTKK